MLLQKSYDIEGLNIINIYKYPWKVKSEIFTPTHTHQYNPLTVTTNQSEFMGFIDHDEEKSITPENYLQILAKINFFFLIQGFSSYPQL